MNRIKKKYGIFISEWEVDVMKLQWKIDEIETAISEAIRNNLRDVINVKLYAHIEKHLNICRIDKVYLRGDDVVMSIRENEDIFNDVPFKDIYRPEEKLMITKKVFDVLEVL